ncbi:FixH family protein [Gaoshiqia sp. Z1-71]|uniref:FixH family protein n=1 Tax=Gaoshiqia hydrogeniformans TaxID=3290090 RepID=UPI003BF7F90D
MKININWGTGIVIAIILMISGMLFLVYLATRQDYYLVEKDYYQKSVNYQEQIERIRNANQLMVKPDFSYGNHRLTLQLPPEFKGKTIAGQLRIYSPVNEAYDLSFNLKPDTALRQYLALEQLPKGRYTLKLDWTAGEKAYYFEQNFHKE